MLTNPDEAKIKVKNKEILIKVVKEQGQIHGTPVADGWVGAIMPKPLANQKHVTDQQTDKPTWQVLESRTVTKKRNNLLR